MENFADKKDRGELSRVVEGIWLRVAEKLREETGLEPTEEMKRRFVKEAMDTWGPANVGPDA